MAFLRFTRDKRGYEHFALVEPVNLRGKTTSNILYWYRTPPGIKVGREAFDEAVRRELEARNPDVTFDWRKILETPIPSADAEMWRERRRIERAARQAVARDDEEVSEDEPDAADTPAHVIEKAVEAATPVMTISTTSSDIQIPDAEPRIPPSPGRGRRRRRRH